MKIAYRYLRKLTVLAVGLPLFLLGIILIPLPGPGILVCALALYILSLEFDWFVKYRKRLEVMFKEMLNSGKRK